MPYHEPNIPYDIIQTSWRSQPGQVDTVMDLALPACLDDGQVAKGLFLTAYTGSIDVTVTVGKQAGGTTDSRRFTVMQGGGSVWLAVTGWSFIKIAINGVETSGTAGSVLGWTWTGAFPIVAARLIFPQAQTVVAASTRVPRGATRVYLANNDAGWLWSIIVGGVTFSVPGTPGTDAALPVLGDHYTNLVAANTFFWILEAF